MTSTRSITSNYMPGLMSLNLYENPMIDRHVGATSDARSVRVGSNLSAAMILVGFINYPLWFEKTALIGADFGPVSHNKIGPPHFENRDTRFLPIQCLLTDYLSKTASGSNIKL